MSDSKIIIELLRNAVRSNDVELTTSLLSKIPLETMTESAAEKLLIFLLNAAYIGNAAMTAALIINQWNALTPDDDNSLSTFTKLFRMIEIDNKVLSFLINNLETEGYDFVMIELINHDSDEKLLPTYKRINDVFGNQTLETYNKLYDLALNSDNDVAADFFKKQLIKVKPYAVIPEWVYDFKDKLNIKETKNNYEYNPEILPKCVSLLLRLPEIKFEPFKLPNIEESIDILTANLNNSGIGIQNIEESKQKLTEEIRKMDNDKRMELLQPVIENQNIYNLDGNLELFRLLGPVNPHYDADLTYEHICYKYGGCRMMTCVCFEQTEEDDPVDDYFVGFCMTCNLKLRSRAHAIRKPLPYGGWIGCYCSVQCLKDTIVIPNILTNLMIDRVSNQLNSYKIQDRIENAEPGPNNGENEGIINSTIGETY